MRESASELFERANKIEDETERARTIWDNNNTRVRDFLFYALNKGVKWVLPEGEPPYTPSNNVHTHGNIWQEVSRFYLFVDNGLKPCNLPMFVDNGLKPCNLPMLKREAAFVQTLEFVHPDDAKLLIAIKDGVWPYDNITADLVNRIWPGVSPA